MHSLQVAIMTPGGGIWGYLYTKTNQRSKCCALRRFHMTDGQNACYQITNDRRSKCAWSNCVLHIPFILSGSPMYAGYIHATHAWLKTGRLGLQRQEEPTIKISPLQITYPAQERLQAKLMGSTLFEQWCGFFYVPREPDKWKWCETGPDAYGVSSLSKKTRKSKHLQVSLKRQHFLRSYLKTLRVGLARV